MAALSALYGCAQASMYADESVWKTPDEARAYVATSLEEYERGTGLHLIFTLQDPRRVIGHIRLKSIDQRHRRCDFEFFFAPHHQNNRWVFEGLAEVMHHIFEEWRFNRISAEIDAEDSWSARILTNLGFTREGAFPRKRICGGQMRNCIGYGILSDEWPSLQVSLDL